jgi:hypothetical protein
MNLKLILYLALVACGSSVAFAETNMPVTTNVQSNWRVSIAEVQAIRLEVEQIGSDLELQFRVSDFGAGNCEKKEVFCELYWISAKGKEEKKPFMRVALKQAAPESDKYSGSITHNEEFPFTHGQKFKVVYKTDSLPLPISTWYACYFH